MTAEFSQAAAEGIPVTSLPLSIRTLDAASLLRNKRMGYIAVLKHLDRWLADRPLNDIELAAYLATLHEQRIAPAIAQRLVEAVRVRARLAEIPPPDGSRTGSVLDAIDHDGTATRQKISNGIRWEEADAAAARSERVLLTGARDAAILSTGSDAFLRTQEIANLDVDALAIEPDGTGRLTIRTSTEEGQDAVAFLGIATVRRLRNWLEKAEIRSGPMFRNMRGYFAGDSQISERGVSMAIWRCARKGSVLGTLSEHSLWVGSAESLAAAGASLEEIQSGGRYASAEFAARGAVAKLRYST